MADIELNCHCQMKQKPKVDTAERLLGILERHSAGLTPTERKAKWDTLNKFLSSVDARAKSQLRQSAPRTFQAARKQA